MTPVTLNTARLRLRPWCEADRPGFTALNADPRVTEFLLGPLTPAQSDARFDRIQAQFAAAGWGWWAAELRATGAVAGWVGLAPVPFAAHFAPAVEVGWRLHPAYWGSGYATEGARAALEFGFGPLGLAEIVSFTVPANLRSRAVMTRLGFTHDPRDDFDHPGVPAGHPLVRHVLYRLPRVRWAQPGAAD